MIFGHIAGPLLKKIDGNYGFWETDAFPIIVLGVLLFYFVIQKEIQELKVSRTNLYLLNSSCL